MSAKAVRTPPALSGNHWSHVTQTSTPAAAILHEHLVDKGCRQGQRQSSSSVEPMCCFAHAVTVVSRSRWLGRTASQGRGWMSTTKYPLSNRVRCIVLPHATVHKPDKLRRRSEASQPARAASEAVTRRRTHVLPRLRFKVLAALLAKRIRPTRRRCRSNLSIAPHHRRIIRMRRGSSLYGRPSRRAFCTVPSHRSSSQTLYNVLGR